MKFSVVMPLYNKELSVARAIASVLSQSFEDFELIIVDDGSTDNSAAVVGAFTDHRMKVFAKENGGVSSARNFALQNCLGEYVAFLDADDEWDCQFLASIELLIRNFPEAAIYSTAYFNRESGKPDSFVTFEGLKNNGNGEILKEYFQLIRKKGASINNSSTSVVKLTYFREGLSFPPGMRSFEDHAVWYRLALRGDVVYLAKALVYIYKDSENRSSASWSAERALGDLAELRRLVEQYARHHIFDAQKHKQFKTLMNYREGYLLRMILRNGSFGSYAKAVIDAGSKGVYALGRSRPGFLLLRISVRLLDVTRHLVNTPSRLVLRLKVQMRAYAQKA